MPEENKKILFCISTLGNGGAERVVANLAADFSKNGYQCFIHTSNRVHNEYAIPNEVTHISVENTETTEIRNPIKRNVARMKSIRRVCKEYNINLIIAFMNEPSLRALIATIGIGTKVIISIRNDPKILFGGGIWKFIGKHIFNHADGYVFQTKEALTWFPEKTQKKSAVIMNDVAPVFFEQKWYTGNNIVTMGRLTSQKNHKLLIDAFADIAEKFQEVNLDIYGDIDTIDDLSDYLKEYIEKKGLIGRVRLMGHTDHPELILSNARIFVLSSDYEGMPNALLEALAVGVPSISTDCPCGGPKAVIEDKKNGLLVPVNDEMALAKAMESLLSNQKYARQLGQNAKHMSEKFRPEIIFKEWKEYIDSF